MSNIKFDPLVVSKGYCCPFGFIRLHLGPKDTVRKILLKLDGKISRATFFAKRRELREGKVKCLNRNTCQAGLWLMQPIPKEED